jgi:hypothetical protein
MNSSDGGGNGGGGSSFHRPIKLTPRKQPPAELAAIAKGKELKAKLGAMKNQVQKSKYHVCRFY